MDSQVNPTQSSLLEQVFWQFSGVVEFATTSKRLAWSHDISGLRQEGKGSLGFQALEMWRKVRRMMIVLYMFVDWLHVWDKV